MDGYRHIRVIRIIIIITTLLFECISYERQRCIVWSSLQWFHPFSLHLILKGNSVLSDDDNKEIFFMYIN